MELLQLMEGADDIRLIGQFLCCFAETVLDFQVLLEVILAGFAVQLQQIIELLHVQLIVAPQLVGLLSGNKTDLLPFLLQLLKFLVVLIGLFGRGNHAFNLLNDVQLLLQVLLFLGFLLKEKLGTFFLDNTHLSLEHFFVLIRKNGILLGIATCFKIGFLCSLAFCEMQFVERGLQQVNFLFGWCLITMSKFFESINYLLLGGIHLLGCCLLSSLLFSSRLLLLGFLSCRFFHYCGGFFHYRLLCCRLRGYNILFLFNYFLSHWLLVGFF